MSSGLAFGATGLAEQRLARGQLGIDVQRSAEEVEERFETLGRTTRRASARGQRQGALWSLLGLAAVTALSGGTAALPWLMGKGLLLSSGVAGAGAAIGSKRAAEKAFRKSGIKQFDPKFHRRATRRGVEDVEFFLGEEAKRRGAEAGMLTYNIGQLGGSKTFLDFVMNMMGQGGGRGISAGPAAGPAPGLGFAPRIPIGPLP